MKEYTTGVTSWPPVPSPSVPPPWSKSGRPSADALRLFGKNDLHDAVLY